MKPREQITMSELEYQTLINHVHKLQNKNDELEAKLKRDIEAVKRAKEKWPSDYYPQVADEIFNLVLNELKKIRGAE